MSDNQTVEDLLQVLSDAKGEAHLDLAKTQAMTHEELSYLANMGEILDPETDGIGCDSI